MPVHAYSHTAGGSRKFTESSFFITITRKLNLVCGSPQGSTPEVECTMRPMRNLQVVLPLVV